MENENSLQAPKAYCSLNPNLSVAMATSASVCAAQLSLIFGGGLWDTCWHWPMRVKCQRQTHWNDIWTVCVFFYTFSRHDRTLNSVLKCPFGKVREMIGTKINGHNKPQCMGISQRDLVRLYEYSQSEVRDWYVRCEKQTDTNPLRRKRVQELSPLFAANKLLDQKICAWGFGRPSITLPFLLPPFHPSFDRQLHGSQWSVMCRLHTCRYLRMLSRKRFSVNGSETQFCGHLRLPL